MLVPAACWWPRSPRLLGRFAPHRPLRAALLEAPSLASALRRAVSARARGEEGRRREAAIPSLPRTRRRRPKAHPEAPQQRRPRAEPPRGGKGPAAWCAKATRTTPTAHESQHDAQTICSIRTRRSGRNQRMTTRCTAPRLHTEVAAEQRRISARKERRQSALVPILLGAQQHAIRVRRPPKVFAAHHRLQGGARRLWGLNVQRNVLPSDGADHRCALSV